jgi:hypothetical protein
MQLFLPLSPAQQCTLLDAMCPTGCSLKKRWSDVEGLDYEFGECVAQRIKGGHGSRRRSKCRVGSAFFGTRRNSRSLQTPGELVLVPLVLGNIFASHGAGMAMSMRG